MLERVRGGQLSAGVFERQRDIHDDDRIVFDDQDRPPLKGAPYHGVAFLARLSATAGGRATLFGGGPPDVPSVDQSSNAATSAMIDWEGQGRVAGAGLVLREAQYTSGKNRAH